MAGLREILIKGHGVMTYIRCKYLVKAELHVAPFQGYAPCRIVADMARRTYLKEWRRFKHLTQKQVVDRLSLHEDPNLPTTEASLSRLENGKQVYGQRVLEALADIYGCEPDELLGRDPTKEGKVIDMVRRLDERRQAQIAAFIKALEESDGTNG